MRGCLGYFTALDSLHDNVTNTDDNSDLAADDPDTLIRIVRSQLKMVGLQV